MKKSIAILALFIQVVVYGQENSTISFKNDYQDTYHLSLIIYTPDGKNQTRVSDLIPNQTKTYTVPVETEIYIADFKQEAFAMKGNDIKKTDAKPYIILKATDDKMVINVTSLGVNNTTKK